MGWTSQGWKVTKISHSEQCTGCQTAVRQAIIAAARSGKATGSGSHTAQGDAHEVKVKRQ